MLHRRLDSEHDSRFSDILSTLRGVLVCAAVLAATVMPAAALDIADAQRRGALLGQALDLGARGDWASAEALAAGTGDALVRDIVLWRKLRAGDGTAGEYNAFVARRGNWPGQEQLAEAVFGEKPASRSRVAGLPADALARWQDFSAIWKKRRYDEAEVYLDGVSIAGMGDPEVWADRRAVLARRAARLGRASLAYRLASRHGLTPAAGYDYSDHEWIAGWVLTLVPRRKSQENIVLWLTLVKHSASWPKKYAAG